jgi:dipeptidase D
VALQADHHAARQGAAEGPGGGGRSGACPLSNTARLDGLEPAEVWRHFAAISEIPRGSGKEAAAIAHVTGVAAQLGLACQTDAVGNVLIRKPATKGMTGRATVALQCHLDMVQLCAPGLAFDFDTQAIPLRVDGDWLCSEGTTLGADNGIGVALILAVLSATDMPHPEIEALFTVDEEVGMTGALAVSPQLLTAGMMINLDMGADDELTIGCAGTLDAIISGTYEAEGQAAGQHLVRITVAGGAGGHSGEDIHLGRANAICLLGGILSDLGQTLPFRLVEIAAEGLPNVIPGTAGAVLAIGPDTLRELDRRLKAVVVGRLGPFATTDPDLRVLWRSEARSDAAVMTARDQRRLLKAIVGSPAGVVAFSAADGGLVETSCNLGALRAGGGTFTAISLIRSGTEQGKAGLVQDIRAAWHETGATCATASDTPAWPVSPMNPLLTAIHAAHIAETGEAPRVSTIHAALECGVFAARYPHMAMVAYGPNMHGIHTTEERLQISSTGKVWAILKRTLATIPRKGEPHDPA